MIYDDEYIKELLECSKEIVDPPPKEYKEDKGHKKKNFTLKSSDGKYFFRCFIRFNIMFNENFSIGLDYKPRNEKGTICLLRCNGSHGENKLIPHHSSFHIHKATAETINSGSKPESHIEITKAYASIEQAIQYFIEIINLNQEDKKKYFPKKQKGFFD